MISGAASWTLDFGIVVIRCIEEGGGWPLVGCTLEITSSLTRSGQCDTASRRGYIFRIQQDEVGTVVSIAHYLERPLLMAINLPWGTLGMREPRSAESFRGFPLR